MKKITWETLDACESAEKIAELLRAANIKGHRFEPTSCPLAVATGWTVYDWAARDGARVKELTPAEVEFVLKTDAGQFRDLTDTPKCATL